MTTLPAKTIRTKRKSINISAKTSLFQFFFCFHGVLSCWFEVTPWEKGRIVHWKMHRRDTTKICFMSSFLHLIVVACERDRRVTSVEHNPQYRLEESSGPDALCMNFFSRSKMFNLIELFSIVTLLLWLSKTILLTFLVCLQTVVSKSTKLISAWFSLYLMSVFNKKTLLGAIF